jgi:hypothetical protein
MNKDKYIKLYYKRLYSSTNRIEMSCFFQQCFTFNTNQIVKLISHHINFKNAV